MEYFSSVSLNDDCLVNIFSYVNQFASFYNFALTCKRFHRVTLNPRNWNVKMVKKKAEFYLKQFLVLKCLGTFEGHLEYVKLSQLLKNAEKYSFTLLTYRKLLDVWESSGPVAAKLFSWIKSQSSVTLLEGPSPTCTTDHRNLNLHLPKCNQELAILTSDFFDHDRIFGRSLVIEVLCGDLEICNEDLSTGMIVIACHLWDEDEIKIAAEPMKPVIELLQEELGETTPPITDQFFVWLCFCFPALSSQWGNQLNEEQKLYFKDKSKNSKPSAESFEPLHEDKTFQEVCVKWMEEREDLYCTKVISEMLQSLVKKSQTDTIQQLCENCLEFQYVIRDQKLADFPKKMMLDLISRISLSTSTVCPQAIAEGKVDSELNFMLNGGQVMKISAELRGESDSYPGWCHVIIEVRSPNFERIEIESEVSGLYASIDEEQVKALLKKFTPVTALIQDCINESMKDEQHIPQITNVFTFVYFMELLELSGALDAIFEDYDGSLQYEKSNDENNTEIGFLHNQSTVN